MRKNSIHGILGLIGLASLGVLGSSTNLAENFFESFKSSFADEMFLSDDKRESRKNSQVGQEAAADHGTKGSIEDNGTPFTEIPEYILYDRMFSRVVKFREMAEEQAARGEEITAFQGYFESGANLNDWQATILWETSVEYVNAVRIIDSQAAIVTEELRLQHPLGSMPAGELIKPSLELLALQDQRDKLALQYRDQVSVLLGKDKFNELSKFVLGEFASGFRVLPLPDGTAKGGQ